MPTTDFWGFLEGELGDEALKVAHNLETDLPDLLGKLGGAAAEQAPAILSQVMQHPLMQHLEAQLPAAALGIAHGLLGLAL